MAHAHSHSHDDNAHLLEQVCNVGVCAAISIVGLLMLHRGMLDEPILARKFHPWIFYGCLTLLALSMIRTVTLILTRRASTATTEHAHDHAHHEHGPDCGHDHPGHEHGHGHACEHGHEKTGDCCHEHGHEHEHEHGHEHAHSATCRHDHGPADCGHDHGAWSPWRYTVLLLPVVLFMLDMPNQGFSARFFDMGEVGEMKLAENQSPLGFDLEFDTGKEHVRVTKVRPKSPAAAADIKQDDYITQVTRTVDRQNRPLEQPEVMDTKGKSVKEVLGALRGAPGSTVKVQVRTGDDPPRDLDLKYEEIIVLQFKELERQSQHPAMREFYQGKMGSIKGQFSPTPDGNVFRLIRLKITCCAADAIQLKVIIVAPEPPKFKPLDWINVTGEITFHEDPQRKEFVPVLRVLDMEKIEKTDPDPEVYQLN